MTSTPPEAPSDLSSDSSANPSSNAGDPGAAGPRATREEIRDLGRLRRSVADRKVAGVAAGIARHLDIDPVIVRVALVVLVFFGGAGLLVYGACWLLLPEDGATDAPFSLDERSRTVALVIVGALAVLALIGDSWGVFGFPWPAAIIGVVVLLVLTRKRSSTSSTSYEAPPPGGPPYATPTAPPAQQRPRSPGNPRKRGPILFWFTMALIALGVGVLGIVDLAGVAVADAAYPATAVGIIGVMLVVGAFYGRAGGLILVGLLASVGLAGATAAGQFESDHVSAHPTSAASVAASYDIGVGELVVDLSGVKDIDNLDGRLITLHGNVGRLEVIVPRGVDVEVLADVTGVGHIVLFGDEHGGFEVSASLLHSGGVDVPTLHIGAELGIGEISVRTSR